MTRPIQAGLGISLLAAGLAGLLFLSQAPASAEENQTMGHHETMHEMMDVMHGSGTSVRMHEGQGGEEMMNACSRMHEMMDGGMMDGGMMDGGMMDGGNGGMMNGGMMNGGNGGMMNGGMMNGGMMNGGMMGTRTS